MNKEFILNYAKGEKYRPDLLVVYKLEAGKVAILNSKVIQNGGESVLIKKNSGDPDTEKDISKAEVLEEAMKFINSDNTVKNEEKSNK